MEVYENSVKFGPEMWNTYYLLPVSCWSNENLLPFTYKLSKMWKTYYLLPIISNGQIPITYKILGQIPITYKNFGQIPISISISIIVSESMGSPHVNMLQSSSIDNQN